MSIAGVFDPLRWYRRRLSVDWSTSSEKQGFILLGGWCLQAFAKETARFGTHLLDEGADRADLTVKGVEAVMVIERVSEVGRGTRSAN